MIKEQFDCKVFWGEAGNIELPFHTCVIHPLLGNSSYLPHLMLLVTCHPCLKNNVAFYFFLFSFWDSPGTFLKSPGPFIITSPLSPPPPPTVSHFPLDDLLCPSVFKMSTIKALIAWIQILTLYGDAQIFTLPILLLRRSAIKTDCFAEIWILKFRSCVYSQINLLTLCFDLILWSYSTDPNCLSGVSGNGKGVSHFILD